MNTKMKPQQAPVVDPQEDAIRNLYLESLHLVERLHRRLLDVIKDEFDRAGRSDVDRTAMIQAAVEGFVESPFIGHGSWFSNSDVLDNYLYIRADLAQGPVVRGAARETPMQGFEQAAERAFAVGVAHRAEARVQPGLEVLEVAVVGEHPVAPPQLAHERVAVLQRDLALRRLADVGDHVAAADGVVADQLGHG